MPQARGRPRRRRQQGCKGSAAAADAGPSRGRGQKPNPATVTVTTRSGETVTGPTSPYRERVHDRADRRVGMAPLVADRTGRFSVDDPLDAHRAQLGKYTDEECTTSAYLQTLR